MPELTTRAERALSAARDAAKRSGYEDAAVSHLALTLVQLKEGVHWNAWTTIKLNVPELELRIDQQLHKLLHDRDSGDTVRSRLEKLIEIAEKTAIDFSHTHVGTEHLFLALIDPRLEDEFCSILRQMGITYNVAKHAILRELDPQYKPALFEIPHKYRRVISEMDLWVDPGSAPPEVIAEILAQISLIYRKMGGSGVIFRFDDSTIPQEAFI